MNQHLLNAFNDELEKIATSNKLLRRARGLASQDARGAGISLPRPSLQDVHVLPDKDSLGRQKDILARLRKKIQGINEQKEKIAVSGLVVPLANAATGSLAAGEKDRVRGGLYGVAGGIGGTIAGVSGVAGALGVTHRKALRDATEDQIEERLTKVVNRHKGKATAAVIGSSLLGAYGAGRLARKHGRTKRDAESFRKSQRGET